MYVSKEYLLSLLPEYRDDWVLITPDQDVTDIVTEIVDAHKLNEKFYDIIGSSFIGDTLEKTCDNIADFLIENVRYSMEPVKVQTTVTPQGILTRGHGDCKHYASFAGGVLGAIERATGKKIKWHYCFASYKIDEPSPYHVFVVVDGPNGEIFIDPTPGAQGAIPVYTHDETIKKSSLTSINGIGAYQSGLKQTGTALPAPSWYPAYLPILYKQADGSLLYFPLNAVPNYSENDILDALLYQQMYVGLAGENPGSAFCVAWKENEGSSNELRMRYIFHEVVGHDNAWNFATLPAGAGIDEPLYKRLQERFVYNQRANGWVAAVNAKYQGIDLLSLPLPTDSEVQRPDNYPGNFPSLFLSAAGELHFRSVWRGGLQSGKWWWFTPEEIAHCLLYAQPVISAGKQPYPANWYADDGWNGAMVIQRQLKFDHFGLAAIDPGRDYRNWDLFFRPPDPPPDSKLGLAIEGVLISVVKLIPYVGATAYNLVATQAANDMSGGEYNSSSFSYKVQQAAAAIAQGKADETTQATNKKYLLIAAGVLLVVGYYYRDDIKKYF